MKLKIAKEQHLSKHVISVALSRLESMSLSWEFTFNIKNFAKNKKILNLKFFLSGNFITTS